MWLIKFEYSIVAFIEYSRAFFNTSGFLIDHFINDFILTISEINVICFSKSPIVGSSEPTFSLAIFYSFKYNRHPFASARTTKQYGNLIASSPSISCEAIAKPSFLFESLFVYGHGVFTISIYSIIVVCVIETAGIL